MKTKTKKETLKKEKLEALKKELRDIKHQMFLSKPLRGYLGNQYPYWEKQKEKVKKKIEKLRNTKKK